MASLPPIPEVIKNQNIQNAGKAPSGYTMMNGNVPSEISDLAKKLLGKEFGYELYYPVNNVKYFFRVEPHYHSPGYVGGPNGWHKGVTVYAPTTNKPVTPKDRIDIFTQLMKELMG